MQPLPANRRSGLSRNKSHHLMIKRRGCSMRLGTPAPLIRLGDEDQRIARRSRTDSFPDGLVDYHFLWANYPVNLRLQPCKNNPLFHTSASVRTFGPLPCGPSGCRNNLQSCSAFFCIEEKCDLPQNVGHVCQIGDRSPSLGSPGFST